MATAAEALAAATIATEKASIAQEAIADAERRAGAESRTDARTAATQNAADAAAAAATATAAAERVRLMYHTESAIRGSSGAWRGRQLAERAARVAAVEAKTTDAIKLRLAALIEDDEQRRAPARQQGRFFPRPSLRPESVEAIPTTGHLALAAGISLLGAVGCGVGLAISASDDGSNVWDAFFVVGAGLAIVTWIMLLLASTRRTTRLRAARTDLARLLQQSDRAVIGPDATDEIRSLTEDAWRLRVRFAEAGASDDVRVVDEALAWLGAAVRDTSRRADNHVSR